MMPEFFGTEIILQFPCPEIHQIFLLQKVFLFYKTYHTDLDELNYEEAMHNFHSSHVFPSVCLFFCLLNERKEKKKLRRMQSRRNWNESRLSNSLAMCNENWKVLQDNFPSLIHNNKTDKKMKKKTIEFSFRQPRSNQMTKKRNANITRSKVQNEPKTTMFGDKRNFI